MDLSNIGRVFFDSPALWVGFFLGQISADMALGFDQWSGFMYGIVLWGLVLYGIHHTETS